MSRHGVAAPPGEAASAPVKAPRRGGLASWPIRRKLIALVTAPLLLIIATGSYLTAQSYTAWRDAERVGKLSSAARAANAVVTDGNHELLQALTYLRTPTAAPKAELARLRAVTDTDIAALGKLLNDPPSGGWSPAVAKALAGFRALNATVAQLRQQVDATNPITGQALATSYFGSQLQGVRQLTTDLASDLSAKSSDARTVDSAAVLSALVGAATLASQETVTLTNDLAANSLAPDAVLALQELKVSQNNLLDLAASRGTAEQRSGIASVRSDDSRIDSFRTDAILKATTGKATINEAALFSSAAGQRLQNLDTLVSGTATTLEDRAASDVRNALIRMFLVALIALGSVILVGLFAMSIARTVTIPMRRLRSGAVDAATVRLPAAVRQIEREGPDAAVAVPPVLPPEAKVGPETREVAQALDGLTGEAVRLATAQVRLRQALDEAFVSMSRRSQSMVEKQLAIIDELESTEEDPEQLRNLFRLDHLAARMRRYNDNLLVLAGSTVRTRSAAPVPIADVFRAATSEMEQYERVRLQPLGGAMVTGAAAGGLIHLLAELLDNAAMYSPPTSPIVLSAAFTQDRGLHLEVTDSGVGIPAAELSDLNARLAMPGSIDTQVPSRMGLFVVARLAQRGGLSVRLAARESSAGTVAEVTVPPTLVIGSSTGPIVTGPSAASSFGTPAEPPRLPVQQGVTPTPLRGIQRPISPRAATNPREPGPARETLGADSGPAVGPPSGLPSRRPGAALAGNPLAAAPGPAGQSGQSGPASPANGSTGPAGLDLGGHTRAAHAGPLGRRPSPAGRGAPGGPPPIGEPPPSWADRANRTATPGSPAGPVPGRPRPDDSGLPRRAPGAGQGSRTPFAAPGSTSDWTDPTAGRGAFEPQSPGPRLDPASSGAPGTTGTPAARTGGGDRSAGSPPPGAPVTSPGHRGGALAPSAATAAAAAAAARSRRPAAPPTSGLFAATGPLTRAPGASPAPPIGAAPPIGTAPSVAPPLSLTGSAPSAPSALSVPSVPSAPSMPLSAPALPTRPTPAPGPSGPTVAGPELPMEKAARQAAAATVARYRPADPHAPMIGAGTSSGDRAGTPIFDSISVWFSDDRGAAAGAATSDPALVIDLRDPTGRKPAATGGPGRAPSTRSPGPSTARPAASGGASGATGNRWAALGDQRWVATNARASAAPQTAGSTQAGLPMRRPGANLLPSAATAASPIGPVLPARRTDAESVRGRLGSYQRGLSSARRARHLPVDTDSATPFNAPPNGESDAGRRSGGQGGDS